MEMNLYNVKYHLKSAQTNKWSTYYAKVIAHDIVDIDRWFNDKWGRGNVKIDDTDLISNLHAISPAVTDDIISSNINLFEHKLTDKIRSKEWQYYSMQQKIQRAKDQWYDIDSVINNGNERKKEMKPDSIWGNKYDIK
jgi:hypothetical protein